MQHLKLFVIIRNENKALELSKTLDSVAVQTYADIECLVADNGSDDNSLEIIKHYASVITHWVSEKHTNRDILTAALLTRATEGYVLIVDAGAVLSDSTVIERMMEGAQGRDVLFGSIMKIFPDGTQQPIIVPAKLDLEPYGWLPDNILQSAFIKHILFKQFNFYDKNLVLTTDWTFLLKVLFCSSAVYEFTDIVVSYLPVGRHGSTDKLSNNQLATKEKYWVIENYVPVTIKNLLLDRKRLNNLEQSIQQYPVVEKLLRVMRKVATQKIKVVESLKRQYRTFRTKVDLPAYRRKFAEECYNIPIIINNRNHLTYLQRLIHSLEKRGYKNIYIIDNDSDYGPLLQFYEETSYKVFLLGKNVGFCALWDTEVFDYFKDSYYVYTDSDLELVEECPNDFLAVLHYLLNKYPLGKVGLSLLTDDLPAHFASRDEVRQWESEFQKRKVEVLACQAMVDTTFALYPPNRFGDAGMLYAFRTNMPYSARHLPWYENTNTLSAEQKYYYQNAKTSSHWSRKIKVE